MPRWLLSSLFCLGFAGAAFAQSGNAVGGGLSSDNGSLFGANVNNVNGINANGTPRGQSPGASMTVGAGNSTMLPGIAGGSSAPGSSSTQPPVPTETLKIQHGTEPPAP